MGNPRMLVVFTLATAVVLGVVISLATNNWLFLVLAIGVHAIATVGVLGLTFNRINEGDKPDPVTEAHMEAGDEPPRRDGLTKSGRRDDREVVL
jgi:hypothetical protein